MLYVTLVTITETINLVTYPWIRSLKVFWRSGSYRLWLGYVTWYQQCRHFPLYVKSGCMVFVSMTEIKIRWQWQSMISHKYYSCLQSAVTMFIKCHHNVNFINVMRQSWVMLRKSDTAKKSLWICNWQSKWTFYGMRKQLSRGGCQEDTYVNWGNQYSPLQNSHTWKGDRWNGDWPYY